jgi:DNA-binding NarL/FixJ family response regulator
MAPDGDITLEIGAGVLPVPLGGTGTELLRILGEALNNARRHARARNVRVRAWASAGRLYAEVSDDGQTSGRLEAGTGIAGMRERADLLGGHLDIRSDPRAGTTMRIEIPLPALGKGHAERVRVLLVDDHATVREAIASAFERDAGFEIVGQAASLAEARTRLDHVDVAVVDLGLPDGNGADLIPELHAINPRAQALVLSARLDRAEIARAVDKGAAAILDKTAHLDEATQAVRRLQAGETLLALDEVVELLRFAGRQREREFADRRRIAQLTRREREVLRLLAEGLDSQQIADRLHISVRTERNHIANILAKLDLHSRLQALVFAVRYDIVNIR